MDDIKINVVVKTHRNIEIKEIKNTKYVYYKDTSITENYKGIGETKEYICKGITSIENIKKVKGLESINNIITVPEMYKAKATIVLISKEDYELLMQGEEYVADIIQYINDIEDFEFEDLQNYKIVLWNWQSHKIADLDQNFISIPISFNYINGTVDNERYHLNKLLKKLKNDPNVLNKEELKISNIPYYNCEEGRNKTISFKYLLPQDIYQKVAKMSSFNAEMYIMDEVIQASDCKKDIK